MQDPDGNIIIAYEGTGFSALSTFGRGSLTADAAIADNKTPQALVDAQQFATLVSQLANGDPIYVTGHSLGGIEAEAACQALGDSCAGGETFGATGLPGNTSAGPGSLINYVDYGDPVGNLSTDSGPGNALGSIVTGDQQHYGNVVMVGNQDDATALKNAADTFNTDLTSPNPFSSSTMNGGDSSDASFWGLIGITISNISQFHPLDNYSSDLNITPPSKVQPEPGPSLDELMLDYDLPLGSEGLADVSMAPVLRPSGSIAVIGTWPTDRWSPPPGPSGRGPSSSSATAVGHRATCRCSAS